MMLHEIWHCLKLNARVLKCIVKGHEPIKTVTHAGAFISADNTLYWTDTDP